MTSKGKENPRGIYLPREYSFTEPGPVYGVAFNGGPVPSICRLSGEVEEQPSGLLVTDHTGRAVEWLRSIGAKVNGSAIDTYAFLRDGMANIPQSHFYVNGFRYLGVRRQDSKPSMLISTTELTDAPIDDLFLGEPDDLARALAELGEDFVAWCRECNFPVKPGKGAAAAMFLRDARFGWGERARIPRRLNERARDNLPGNHYRPWRFGKFAKVVEYDQRSAHHNAAKDSAFPDSLNFGGMGHADDKIIASAGTDAWRDLTGRPGLFLLRLRIDRRELPTRTYPFLEDLPEGRDTVDRWVWSSELPYLLEEPGVTPVGIVACDTSHTTNPGMNNFARWALSELDRNAGNRRRLKWLKQFLLTAYGAVATRPKVGMAWSTHPPAAGGKGRMQHKAIGGKVLEVYISGKARPRKPAEYVNVYMRGIIEALVRAKTILKARELDGDVNVMPISEYADAIFVAMIEEEDKWKLFASPAEGAESTSYERESRDEKSGSGVRATSRATRNPRSQFPLPSPTPLIGPVTLVSRDAQQKKVSSGSQLWSDLHPLLSEDSSTGEWTLKRTLHNFELENPTHWRADEDRKSPGVRRKKPGAVSSPGP